MKFGVNTFIWADRFGREQIPLLARIKEAGFDGLEIPLFRPADLQDSELQRAIAASGLECTVCSVLPEGLNTISDDAEVRKQTLAHLKACVRAVAEIGSKLMAGPLYAPVGYLPGRRRNPAEWTFAVDAFSQLGASLDEFGVSLAIEPLNRYETYFLNTAADAVALCTEISNPRIGMLFDTYHANIEEKNVAEAIRRAGSRIFHFHSCENDRGTPGSGHIDWQAVFAALRAVGYDRWLTIESFGFSLGALSAAASIWRDLAQWPETIAFEGVKFLKRAAANAS
jgi:D-psicose/D-tagatose/L-ribulose 3-epimerase